MRASKTPAPQPARAPLPMPAMGGQTVAAKTPDADQLRRLASEPGRSKLYLDFRNVEFLNANGLGQLVALHNSLEASMAKAKAGKAVTLITQKAVEILGPMGYSRDWLVEKWMRDGKINDIYEYVKGRSDAKIGPGRPAVKQGG